jgi:hypothetical protein
MSVDGRIDHLFSASREGQFAEVREATLAPILTFMHPSVVGVLLSKQTQMHND